MSHELLFYRFQKSIHIFRIDYIIFAQPCPSSNLNTKLHMIQMLNTMRICVDHKFDANFLGKTGILGIKIKADRKRVDLHKKTL